MSRLIKLTFLLVGLLAAEAAEVTVDFASNPFELGWNVLREPGLWSWDSAERELHAVWDSSQSNNAFYIKLPYELSRRESFGLEWEMVVEDIKGGMTNQKPHTFEIAVGFFRVEDLADEAFRRGVVGFARNVVEWDFFPDTGFGPTIWPIAISQDGRFNYNDVTDFVIHDLPLHEPIKVRLEYDSEHQEIRLSMWSTGGELIWPMTVPLAPSFSDFRVNAAGLINYSDAGSDGSVFARAIVRWIRVWWTDPPRVRLFFDQKGTSVVLRFYGPGGWRYRLLESDDLKQWRVYREWILEDDQWVELELQPVAPKTGFYRILLERP